MGDYYGFESGFYNMGERDVGAAIFQLVTAYGNPCDSKDPAFPDLQQVRLGPKGFLRRSMFVAFANTWGHGQEHQADLRITTNPIHTFLSGRLTLRLQMEPQKVADNLIQITRDFTPGEEVLFSHTFDAVSAEWRLRRPGSTLLKRSVVSPSSIRNEEYRQPDPLLQRAVQLTSPRPNTVFTKTDQGIPILPFTETHRRLRFFGIVFRSVVIRLIEATGQEIRIEPDDTKEPGPGKLRLVRSTD